MDLIDHNNLSNNDEAPTPYMVLAIALLAVLLLGLIGSGILSSYLNAHDMAIEDVMSSLSPESTVSDRNLVRFTLLINHLTTFVLPGILAILFCYHSKWLRGLSLQHSPKLMNLVLGSILIFTAFPLVQYTFFLNKKIPLPEWMLGIEDQTRELTNNLLITDTPAELLFNIFIIAIIPAIGEEIIFRGILQKQLQRIIKNPHIAVWVAALVFSGIHMQFQGFFPRMLLGALMGYLFYWSGNLWVPIIAHFFNNAFQVVAQYLFSEEMSSVDLDAIESVPITAALASLFIVLGLGYLISQNNSNSPPQV